MSGDRNDPQQAPYGAIALADVPAPDGEPMWRPIRHHFNVASFGVNGWVAQAAGDEVVEDHVESEEVADAAGHEELYLVVRGHVTFTVDGETLEAPAGTLVHIRDPRLRRVGVARDAGTTVLSIGGEPGMPYSVSPWERRHFPGD